ncbi:hypothetical protein [Salipiger sp. PrR003]|uniref:hypothetical protein n=1 Tax=Salipiger sp. PrR003 TaxID=2706776 RepID=UPI0013D8ED37|nr:hypothetical protein [Salipiger sp. PrR003]NDV49291.1 hypothetical protein [Salipiger sp. PrR003]
MNTGKEQSQDSKRISEELEKTLEEIRNEDIPERLLELAHELQTQLRRRGHFEN